MLSAYSVLANGGYKVEPYFIDSISDRDGNIIYQAPQATFCDECYQELISINTDQDSDQPEVNSEKETVKNNHDPLRQTNNNQTSYTAPRVMSEENNFLTVDMLKDVIRSGTGRKALALNRDDLAGKTGTTNDYVDAWFTGFNSKIATTVWVGFDKPKSMGRGEAGGKAALPIWVDYMSTALKDIPKDSQETPSFIEEKFINRSTGKITFEEDPEAIKEFFAINRLNNNLPTLPLDGNDLSENTDLTSPDIIEGSENPTDSLYNNEQPDNIFNPERIIETPEDTQGLF